jgi:hypothetical protein
MSWLSAEIGIISSAVEGKTSWSDAAAQTEALGQKIEAAITSFAGPGATAVAAQTVTTIKTDVSNAISVGASLMGPAIAVAAKSAEGLLDGLIVSGLGAVGAGALAPAATAVNNDAIDGFAAYLISAINARAAQAKAALTIAPAAPTTTAAS